MKRMISALKFGLLALGLLVGFPGLARADVKFNFNTIDVPLCPLLPNALCPRTAVNGDGNNAIVGDFDEGSHGHMRTHGFILRAGAYTQIDVPDAAFCPPSSEVSGTSLNGINDTGDIVGTYADPSCTTAHAFLLSGGIFTKLDPDKAVYSQAGFINVQGQVVGSYRTCETAIPCKETNQKWHGFSGGQAGSFQLLSTCRTTIRFGGPSFGGSMIRDR
jgi:hypothetical protein